MKLATGIDIVNLEAHITLNFDQMEAKDGLITLIKNQEVYTVSFGVFLSELGIGSLK